MKTLNSILTIIIFSITSSSFAQLKVHSSGGVLVGTTAGSPAPYSLAVTGSVLIKKDLFLYNSSNGAYGRVHMNPTFEIGSSTDNVVFWYTGIGYNQLFASGYTVSSDRRLKSNIKTIKSPLETLMKLRGTIYEKDETEDGTRTESGFIAQEVEKVLPHIVSVSSKGDYGLNYYEFIPYLVEGVKEQVGIIDDLKAELSETNNKLNNALAEIESLKNETSTTVINKQTDGSGVVLEQNVPNPFSDQTEIRYSIPNFNGNAYLGIYDLNGKQLARHDLIREKDNIIVSATDLGSGMYIYALIVDGKQLDSKKMIIE